MLSPFLTSRFLSITRFHLNSLVFKTRFYHLANGGTQQVSQYRTTIKKTDTQRKMKIILLSPGLKISPCQVGSFWSTIQIQIFTVSLYFLTAASGSKLKG